jgi:hypothetical protein
MHPDFERLKQDFGILMHRGEFEGFIADQIAHDVILAADAQPGLITVSNSGIPAFLSNYMDPKVITVLTTPNKAAKILGETKKGTWVTRTMTFPMVESVGETASYGDWSNNGSTNANTQFPERQSFHYQTITRWGERQMDEAGLAQIDWAQRLNIASAMVLDKNQNNSYFFGIGGLQNYGLLNDPALPAAIAPNTKAAGGTGWANATPTEVYTDVQKLYNQLVTQSNGLIDEDTKLVLVTSPGSAVYLKNTNLYNVAVTDSLKKNFPTLRFETAPQYYSTTAGNTVQLIAEEIDGQETGYCSFTEKMRAHPVIAGLSSFKQKKSQGTWGAIIFLPVCFAQMVGV